MKAEAEEFFMQFTKTNIKRWAIENPVGCMNTVYRKPDQIVQPFWFGDSASKNLFMVAQSSSIDSHGHG